VASAFLMGVHTGLAAHALDDGDFQCTPGFFQDLECTQTSGDPLTCGDITDGTCTSLCDDVGWYGRALRADCDDGPPLTFDCVCGLNN
jgi:hypothetical protein